MGSGRVLTYRAGDQAAGGLDTWTTDGESAGPIEFDASEVRIDATVAVAMVPAIDFQSAWNQSK